MSEAVNEAAVAGAQARPAGWQRHAHKIAAAAIWVAVVAVGFGWMRANHLTPGEAVLAVLTWAQRSPWAPLLYILLYAVRPLTLFSATLLTIAGGFLFGPWWGLVYTFLAANLSATVAYAVGRFFGQGLLNDPSAQGIVHRYARRMREHGFETVLIMRLVFVPYDLVGYLAGLLRVRYLSFLLATIIGCTPGMIAFVLLGASASPASIDQFFRTGRLPSLDWRIAALAGVMMVASLGLARVLRRRELPNQA